MTTRLTLAQLSDIHLPPPRPYRGHIHPKRLLGMLNWHRRRARQHTQATLDAIVADLRRQSPDHIAVTGDLVNVGLAWEHAAAARWLAALGAPSRVTAIPGNHDIYVDGAGVTAWQAFMADAAPGPPADAFPFVRHLGRIALIGLSSAIPTPLFHAYGRLGSGQIERLAATLARLGSEGFVRVVLIHHPPLPGQAPHRCALHDAAELTAVLASHGAELVLHGHNHRAMIAYAAGPRRPIPVVGVPSASLGMIRGSQSPAGYNLFHIAPDPDAPIELIERGISGPGGPVGERRRLVLGASQAAIA